MTIQLVDFKRNLNQYCPLLKEQPAHENCSNFHTILFLYFIYIPRFSIFSVSLYNIQGSALSWFFLLLLPHEGYKGIR